MRQLRYSVAMSLDGFIAGPKGEYDWITMDPTADFTALYKQFDTLLMGRRTYEMACKGPGATIPGMKTIVCSNTLRARSKTSSDFVGGFLSYIGFDRMCGAECLD